MTQQNLNPYTVLDSVVEISCISQVIKSVQSHRIYCRAPYLLWVLRRLLRADLYVAQPRVEVSTCAYDNLQARLVGQTSLFMFCRVVGQQQTY